MPARKPPKKRAKPTKSPRRVKKKYNPQTMARSQHQLNHIFDAGRAALKRPAGERSKSDKAAITEFKRFAPSGTARRLNSRGLAKKRKTY